MAGYKTLLLIMIVVIFISFSYSAGILLHSDCVLSPTCTCYPHNVICSSRGLMSIPTVKYVNISGQYFSVHVDNNNISMIRGNAFANILSDNASFIFLFFQDNLISNLAESCFNGIEHGVYLLNLTNNKLSSLPRVLVSLTKLTTLCLNENPLANLDSYTMSEIGRSLNSFIIDLSNFDSWPEELHSLRQLSDLVLYSITFSSLRLNAFQGFEQSLRYLYIFNSYLEELPVAVCHLSGLRKIIFDNNDNLSENKLRTEDCHLYLHSLRDLNLRNNSIVEFPNILRNASDLDRLELGYNDISFIQDTSIPPCFINELYLNNNYLTRIPYALNKISRLVRLDLSYNNIVSIEEPDLQKLSTLTQLYLEYNKIRFVSKQAFSNNALLNTVNLSNNYLKSIPEAFTLLPHVSNIYLEQNEIDCICIDPALKSWNTTKVNIAGNCKFGSENLQSFVASHAPTCG